VVFGFAQGADLQKHCLHFGDLLGKEHYGISAYTGHDSNAKRRFIKADVARVRPPL